jgi:hypothetical protein
MTFVSKFFVGFIGTALLATVGLGIAVAIGAVIAAAGHAFGPLAALGAIIATISTVFGLCHAIFE